ncbi:SRPBCC family protein [Streptomyces sp. TLI_171]|uniref:SRPBCC family protein n=1 Tax=Streptomyces sp. TLI_171 TaxID=1938859 RepID=UPI000C1A2FF1|nr:SRPBCC family protein [Streptomyces sp. TLI_171]RKE17352.1 polyketide cyclase/dehydrase/lipid transport protein [Streptomyces sp. TLI_171]
MAQRQRLIEAAPEQVWDVLANARSYAQWVVGTQDVLDSDDDWPAVGARLGFRVGVGPATFEDTCVVRICEPLHRLELEAAAKPLGTARIAFGLIPWAEHTLVLLDEHPLRGLGARLENPLTELALHLRNRQLLGNLARAVRPAAGKVGR